MTEVAVDTSVAVPYVLRSHTAHALLAGHLRSRSPRLTAHSLAESYSVLTRLPGDARLAPADAARLLSARFGATVPLDDLVAGSLPVVLAPVGIAGGAVYDALVALAARRCGPALGHSRRRAAATYAALGATVDLVVG
jgi:predicted nucleic acid-binding protein